jgi:FkbM family methyltransferase
VTSRGNARNLTGLFREATGATKGRLALYVAAYLLYRATGWKAYRGGVFSFRFGRFHVATGRGDLGTIGEIFVDRLHQVRDFVPSDGDTCVDVGAHIGCVALQWRLSNPTGRIIAVEPHPVTVQALRANCALNPGAPITVVEAAVGSTDGPVTLILDAHENRMALTAGEHLRQLRYTFAAQRRASVPGMTLDSLAATHGLRRVHLLKIDVEGFEVECLKGAEHALGITDRVIVEVHSMALRTECARILTERGFSFRVIGKLMFAQREQAA